MNRDMKKKVTIVSILAAVLVALVLLYVFVLVPLVNGDLGGVSQSSVVEPPEIYDGEGLYLDRMVTVYPEVNKNDITYISVSNAGGTYAFRKYYTTGMEGEEMRFVGSEGLEYDESMYSILIAYLCLPVSYQSNLESCAPMRNLTDEQMAQYGVTEENCIASYTIGYLDNGEEKHHTIYVGYKTFSSEATYYVAYKGRNSVYRFHQEGVEQCLLMNMVDYLSPLVFGKYSTVTEAMVNITRFKLGIANPDKQGQSDYVESLVEIVSTGKNSLGTSYIYDLLYKSKGTGEIARTSANVEQLSAVFTALYTYFQGDKVMCVHPTVDQLKQYGLDPDSKQYYLTAQFSDDPEDYYQIQLSDLIDGYYYAVSTFYGKDYPMLVRIPEATISFMGESDADVFAWAGTDVSSLFYEYLLRDRKSVV